MTAHNRDIPPRPSFLLSELAYELPEALIAEKPPARREDARLLTLYRKTGGVGDRHIPDLTELLRPGDLLVLNDTKVIPAKFTTQRATGGKVPGLFIEEESDGTWRVMLEGSGRIRVGEKLRAISPSDETVTLELTERYGDGQWRVAVEPPGQAEDILDKIGEPPLPPYIARKRKQTPADVDDQSRYQTVYAKTPGAIAAPTAGLHLTDALLGALRDRDINTAWVTLHVGVGTFKPIKVDDLSQHDMHGERYVMPGSTAEAIRHCRAGGGRIVAVGTTSVRVLESAAAEAGDNRIVETSSGVTHAFIYPPYRFRAVDALLTNFHLPGSTLIALVMAFAGVDRVRKAYAHAVENAYRFYSYGDAMLIQ